MGCSSSKNASKGPKAIEKPDGELRLPGREQEHVHRGEGQGLRDPSMELSATKQVDLNEKINMLMTESPVKDDLNGNLEGKESEIHDTSGDVVYMDEVDQSSGVNPNGKSVFSWLLFHQSKPKLSNEAIAKDAPKGIEVDEHRDEFNLTSVLKTPSLQTKMGINGVPAYRDLSGTIYYPDGSTKESPPSSSVVGKGTVVKSLSGGADVYMNVGKNNEPLPTMEDLIEVYKRYELEYDEDGRVARSEYTGRKYQPRQLTCVEAATENLVDEVNCF